MVYEPQTICNVCKVKLKPSEDDFMGRCKKHTVKFSELWYTVQQRVRKEREQMKKYIVSAAVFGTKKEVEDQIQEWIDSGTYNDQSIIYEIDENTPQYKGVIKLKKLYEK